MIELDVIGADDVRRDEHPPVEKQWRSFGDLTDHPAHRKIRKNEFMDGAAKPPGGPSRREFMKLMGASMALAGLTACRRPVEKVLPYVRPPEEVIPGIPLYFATSMPFRGAARGLLVESHEGRPTKVEGNPEHPVTQGATGAFAQASVLTLYDPDRSRYVLREGGEATWQDFVGFCSALGANAASQRLAVLAEPTSSPTVQAVRDELQQRFPQLRWVEYAPNGDDPLQFGMQQAFGRPLRPLYRFDEAEVIVSLDADFLGPAEQNFVGNTRRFAASRRLDGPEDELSRLYCIESGYSITGGQADNRLRMQAGRIPVFAAALAAELGLDVGGTPDALEERARRWAAEVANDLEQAGPQGVVLAGDTQPPEVHALCAAINDRLGSVGGVMTLLETDEGPQLPRAAALADLVGDMRGGRVDTLFMMGVNPLYDLPPELGFAEAMARVDETIHLGLYLDETAQESRWHVPRAHYLEAWGDGRAYDGTLSFTQPLIAPLYDPAHSEIEVLGALATGLDRAGYDLVRETWRGRLSEIAASAGDNFEERWDRLLHNGFLSNSQYPTATPAAATPDLSGLDAPGEGELELVFRLDPTLLAGQYSNNAWMQELPDPTTKITWDNVALMSRRTAEKIGVTVEYDEGKYHAELVELTVNGETITLPAWIQPGYPDDSIGLTYGYGRRLLTQRPEPEEGFWDFADAYEGVYERGEPVANGVGVNVAPLRPASLAPVAAGAVEARPTGELYLVATTQDHGSMEGRPLVIRATLDTYRENPDFADDAVHMLPGVPEDSYEEYPMLWQEDHPSDQPPFVDSDMYVNQWGMVIDLNTCTGCSACIVACQSENNVQVVGKEEVARGREMHWLRLDRYYASPAAQSGHGHGAGAHGNGAAHAGSEASEHGEEAVDEEVWDEPQMVFQPVMCQHCENAPCESVCPVAATVHTPDGTNQMVYNRCIGTRYCSNNCPYKVRRFNFFNWAETVPPTIGMAHNPEVTVRFRGVMEKCSWCVQRIRGAQQRADNEERRLRDDEVLTACQQACPANAIIFGDINDPTSEVSQLKQHARDYEMLAQLNVKPRLSYLGRVTNPNPQLEGTPA